MKYMGSKSRIRNEIIPILLKGSKGNETFIDAFCGSCSIVEEIPASYKRIANDKNRYLVNMFIELQKNGTDSLPFKITRNSYKEIREDYHKIEKERGICDMRYLALIGWVGFMGSFNGRFFDGGYSGRDVKGRDYIKENINNIIKTIPKIQGVKFTCLDFRSIDVPENSIVYCDPPYKGTKQYSTSKNFDHDSFWMWVRKVSRKAKVFVSEYSAPEDFECIWEKQITNAMSTKNTYKPTEKLFVLKGV